jgi:hypothetical protein
MISMRGVYGARDELNRSVVRGPRAIALAAIAILAGCGLQDPYPIPEGQPSAAFHPAAVGEAVTEVVMFIEARPGPRVVLLLAEPIGQLDGASVAFYSSRAVVGEDGDMVIGEQLDELEGTIIEAQPGASGDLANVTGVVAEVTASEPGRYVITAVRLTFRYGGTERAGEGTDVVMTVCAGDPAPPDCE